MTFVRNHAQGILACDFFVTVTASFRVLYVFVVMEVGTRRIAHFNVTRHPTADWTLRQLREVVTGEEPCRFLIRDRDRIYSSEFDSFLKAMGLRILKTPFRAPQANAFCERLAGTIRRECLDFLIPPCETPAGNSQRVGGPLQPEPPTFEPGAGDSRTLRRHAGATRFRLRYSAWSPGG
jgi:transposase InsO family protein